MAILLLIWAASRIFESGAYAEAIGMGRTRPTRYEANGLAERGGSNAIVHDQYSW